jgi:hypothetical protein
MDEATKAQVWSEGHIDGAAKGRELANDIDAMLATTLSTEECAEQIEVFSTAYIGALAEVFNRVMKQHIAFRKALPNERD